MRAAPFESEPNAVDRLVDDLAGRRAQRENRRMWAAMMLAPHVEVCRSILVGRPVHACQLDAEALRRSRRGEPLPPSDAFVRVRWGHLDAIAEAGPFRPKERKR